MPDPEQKPGGPDRRWVVQRVNHQGLFIVQDQESQNQLAITFDKIDGYVGQPASTIGLHEGSIVDVFFIDDSGVVSSVKIREATP